MKFFQRRSRPSVRDLFAGSQSRQINLNFYPLQICQTYVPKCLSETSPSHILTGGDEEEVEDFSAGCWLQDHLHQFGNAITQLVTSSSDRSNNDYNDDCQTCSGSDVSTEADENDDNLMFEDLDNTNAYEYRPLLRNFLPGTISHYTMVQEPPPYGFDEPPPSYEEAVQVSFSSLNITNWDVLF